MKKMKTAYWIATGLFTALMLMSAGMYIFNHETISQEFLSLGYPAYIIYPLALAKILGLIAIVTGKSKTLKEWAYAGFFFDILLAFFAHIMVSDGEFAPAILALLLLAVSYFSSRKIQSMK